MSALRDQITATDTTPVKTRSPEALLLDILRRKGLAACVGVILRFVCVLS